MTDRLQEEEMLEVEQWAEIHRLHRVEKLSARAIARRLGLARNTVSAALDNNEPPRYRRAHRTSCLDPFHDRIAELLADLPELSAVRISEIIEPEGYSGGLSTLRTYLRTVRPKPVQAFQRTEYRPGEIGQLDWAAMPDRIPSPTGEPRPVWALVLTLGYSRLLDMVFSFGTKLPDFLRAHAQLLAFVGGVPHTLVYDNMGSVVTSHQGKEVIFNPDFLVFAQRYGFKPHACTPRQPHEKGLVERPIAYIKGNFWAARHFTGLDDLQAQANTWRDEKANVRNHSTLHERPVDRFEREKGALLPLPSDHWMAPEIRFAKVTSQGLIHVDGNQYSVPALLARQQVSVHLNATSVVIYHEHHIVATHQRCWGRHRLFQHPDHLARPWSVHVSSAPEHCSGGLQLPAKARVRVAVPDLSRYDRLSQEVSDEH